jgi:hypothetical protein
VQPGWDGDRPPALKFDDERKARFLATLEEHGMVTIAARAAAVTTDTVYKHREADEAFAKAWEEACAAYCDRLEMEAYRRALKAWTSPQAHSLQDATMPVTGPCRRHRTPIDAQDGSRPRHWSTKVTMTASSELSGSQPWGNSISIRCCQPRMSVPGRGGS